MVILNHLTNHEAKCHNTGSAVSLLLVHPLPFPVKLNGIFSHLLFILYSQVSELGILSSCL